MKVKIINNFNKEFFQQDFQDFMSTLGGLLFSIEFKVVHTKDEDSNEYFNYFAFITYNP